MEKVRLWFLETWEKYKHFCLCFYFLGYLAWFAYLEKTVTTRFHVIHLTVDDYIPFCEVFVIPYLMWFVFIAWGVIYFGFHNKKDYYRLCAFMFTGMTIFLIISTVYPNGHYLRPVSFENENIFTDLVQMVYSNDTSTNLFPSIHVYNSIAVYLAVHESEDLRNRRGMQFVTFIVMISIVLSTVFIKQHSMFDVLTAILLAGVMYMVVYGHEWSHQTERAKAHAKRKRNLPQLR
ncbi:MAG: phosphatase PAP2 family protein [Clostridiales bacterium]|nr:phosphatase PAP2 family protein [Clostridiales bacterium]